MMCVTHNVLRLVCTLIAVGAHRHINSRKIDSKKICFDIRILSIYNSDISKIEVTDYINC